MGRKMRAVMKAAALLALVAVLVVPQVAIADTSVEVVVTATPEFISIDNSVATFSAGVLTEGQVAQWDASSASIVTNDGSVSVDISIQGTDMDNGTDTWDLAADGTAGSMTYAMRADSEESGVFGIIIKPSAPDNLTDTLATSALLTWSMDLTAPATYNHTTAAEMSGTVTLTASKSS